MHELWSWKCLGEYGSLLAEAKNKSFFLEIWSSASWKSSPLFLTESKPGYVRSNHILETQSSSRCFWINGHQGKAVSQQ